MKINNIIIKPTLPLNNIIIGYGHYRLEIKDDKQYSSIGWEYEQSSNEEVSNILKEKHKRSRSMFCMLGKTKKIVMYSNLLKIYGIKSELELFDYLKTHKEYLEDRDCLSIDGMFSLIDLINRRYGDMGFINLLIAKEYLRVEYINEDICLVFTDKGLKYGKNLLEENNEPWFYCDTFIELYKLICI